MNINTIINNGINNILKTVGTYYIKSKQGREFLRHTVPQIHQNEKRRKKNNTTNSGIPPFLIASIASSCNLRCTGCYARASGLCDTEPDFEQEKDDMNKHEWQSVFSEASELGISFILLAGGEPFTRQDIIETASTFDNIIFPIFTNGTIIDDDQIRLIDKNRNLIPILSIEGEDKQTDLRRGPGVYEQVVKTMENLKEKNIMFGASVTVTSENFHLVTSESFMEKMHNKGCGLLFFVEYVPAEEGTESLVLGNDQIEYLNDTLSVYKRKYKDMTVLSFPGDEEKMGGCLASGRGFFHINSHGDAEPCPFSPYSVNNLRTHTIKEVLESEFFSNVRNLSSDSRTHTGGCVLFDKKDQVKMLL